MRTTVAMWGAGGIAILLGVACSGTGLHEVGDLNSGGAGGNAGSSSGGPTMGGSNGTAGSNAVSPGGALGTAGSYSPGGGEGVLDPPGDTAGAGGQGGGDALTCPACQLVATGQDVRGVAANDQKVFWVDYGTSDALGNYNGDGRLLARNLSSGATTVLADSLPGPESVSLSSQYAYIFVDQRSGPDQTLGVVRMPLAGGAVQPLQAVTAGTFSTYQVFAPGPGYEYWNWGGAVYRIAEVADAVVETFLEPRGVLNIFTDDARLYFQDSSSVWTVPFTGGTPAFLYDPGQRTLQLVTSDYLYAIESPLHAAETGTYLTRMPKAGGAWNRVVSSPSDLIWSQVAIDGDHYFIDEPTLTERRMLQGSLSASTSQTTLASEAFSGNEFWSWKAWTWSSVGIFLADSNGLYLAATSP